MADTLQASPDTPWMTALADRLRDKLPEGIRKMTAANPVLGALAGSIAAPQLEAVSRGLRNWSYGDKFFHGRANEPIIGPRQEDMLAAAPVGVPGQLGGASKSIFVPAKALRTRHELGSADLARARGATPEELWARYQLLKNPRRPKDMNPQWLAEIDDSTATLSPTVARMTPAQREDAVQLLEPIYQHGARLRTRNMDLPADNTYELQDYIQHPELLAKFPELRTIPVTTKFDPSNPSRGTYNPEKNTIGINTAQFFSAPTMGGDRAVLGTTLHEATHALQQKYDMPSGASVDLLDRPKEVWDIAAEALRARKQDMAPETLRHWEMLLDSQNKRRFDVYKQTPGEQFARLAQERLGLTPYSRAATMPSTYGLDEVADPKFANSVLGGAKHILENPTRQPGELLDWLRGWGQAR